MSLQHVASSIDSCINCVCVHVGLYNSTIHDDDVVTEMMALNSCGLASYCTIKAAFNLMGCMYMYM